MNTKENRIPVISRTYEKDAHRQMVWIYQLTAPDITGEVFDFAVFLDNVEIQDKRITSGNKFDIRKSFITYVQDLNDDGWKCINRNSLNADHRKFFEPEQL